MHVNQATGEVVETFDGKTFTFKATLSNVADLCAKLSVDTVGELFKRLHESNIQALNDSMRYLCISENRDELRNIRFMPNAGAMIAVFTATMAAGMPEPKATAETYGDDSGN